MERDRLDTQMNNRSGARVAQGQSDTITRSITQR